MMYVLALAVVLVLSNVASFKTKALLNGAQAVHRRGNGEGENSTTDEQLFRKYWDGIYDFCRKVDLAYHYIYRPLCDMLVYMRRRLSTLSNETREKVEEVLIKDVEFYESIYGSILLHNNNISEIDSINGSILLHNNNISDLGVQYYEYLPSEYLTYLEKQFDDAVSAAPKTNADLGTLKTDIRIYIQK